MPKPSTTNYTWHCANCGQSTEAKEGAPCPICGGPILFADAWVTEFRKQLRGVRAAVQVAKEDITDSPPKE